MSDTSDTGNTKLGSMFEAIGGIAGLMVLVYTLLQGWVSIPTAAAIVTAVVCGIGVSLYFALVKHYPPVSILMGWMVVTILALLLFVVFPREMVVEGHVRNAWTTPIPRIPVMLRDYRNAEYRAQTDAEGAFVFLDVPSGRFSIESSQVSTITIDSKGVFIRRQLVELIEHSATAIPSPTSVGKTPAVIATPTVTTTTTVTPTATRFGDELPGGTERTAKKDQAVLVFVPSGEVDMGAPPSDELADLSEKPLHAVFVPGFWVDKFEVSNKQYRLCVEGRECSPPVNDVYMRNEDYADYPVRYVLWQDAHDYCMWAGRRLLTEAEWERAARGDDLRVYPWGNPSPDGTQANLGDVNCTFEGNRDPDVDDGYDRTAPVFEFPSGDSVFGARNMAGNVREWVHDWYSSTFYRMPEATERGTKGPGSGTKHVVKGGSWAAVSHWLRISSRQGFPSEMGNFDAALTGIRCGMDYDPNSEAHK